MSESVTIRSARRFPIAVLAGLCAAAFVATPARAAVTVADFEGASATADGFPGAPGNGWTSSWNTVNGATGVVYTGTVANSTPLNASPNYLSVSNSGSTAAGTVVVRRVFGTNGDVDPAQPHRVAFQFRFDGNMANFSGSFNDRINLFADPGGVNTTAVTNAWMMGVAAANNGTSNVVPAPNTWFFFDAGNELGNAQGFTGSNLVNTGVTLTSGTVYSFTVDVYPALGKYDATISNGTQSFTGTDLQFRNLKASTATADVPDTLHFGIQSSAATDNHAFSLDGLSITAIPEPGSLAFLGLTALALVGRRRSR
jgi:uncharacterized protein (TIGR03382 family)